jgi:hypothetical protein
VDERGEDQVAGILDVIEAQRRRMSTHKFFWSNGLKVLGRVEK